MNITAVLSETLGVPAHSVDAVVGLLDEGATVPFISRYRKERTGGLDDVQVREIEIGLGRLRELEKRKATVICAIEEAGAMTAELRRKIEEADSAVTLEDIYAPYKPRRRTRAAAAREKGLEPFAKMIMSGNCADPWHTALRFVRNAAGGALADAGEAIAGAADIIAEWAAESPKVRNVMRRAFRSEAQIEALADKSATENQLAPYRNYIGFRRSLRTCSSHQYLALRRAERDGALKVRLVFESEERVQSRVADAFIPGRVSGDCRRIIEGAVADSYRRLLRPSVETEISAEKKSEADRTAISIFAENLRQLLMAPPLRGKRVLAVDPGFRTGCKVVCLDEQGNLLDDAVIYPTPPKSDMDGAARILKSLIGRHALDVIALGDATASRETENFLKKASLMPQENIYVVSESGASVYSASGLAREEFPDKDVTVRGAVSIGRRLIDPLAELVKIEPKSIGVGQYQHDVDQNELKEALDYTVMSCVNQVGVDVNTASVRLLSYISGIGPALASNIVAYRAANGSFRNRSELMKVPRMGEKAFELSAGFLRIPDGDNPLDNTGIHPESYNAVKRLAVHFGTDVGTLVSDAAEVDRIDCDEARTLGVCGVETLADILSELRKPGRDPRMETRTEPSFSAGIESFDDLCVGLVVDGVVNNITAFGAFISLGIKENGLLHVSQIAGRRVSSPAEVLRLGQHLKVRIIDIDPDRRRISLSAKDL